MSVNVVLVVCAQALFFQSAFTQCTSRAAVDASNLGAPIGLASPGLAAAGLGLGYNGLATPALAYDGYGASALAGRGLACDGLHTPAMEFTATNGGALPVTCVSAIAPTGISVVSENAFEGILSVAGELPFTGTTGMDGAVPSAGAGAINHACGDGRTAIVSEAAIAPGAAITPVVASFGPAASVAPTAGAFGSVPIAGRFAPGGCGRNVVY